MAYLGLTMIGVVVGFLAGAEVISGTGLAMFILGSLAIFIPWAVWRLDPESLVETEAYREGKESDESH